MALRTLGRGQYTYEQEVGRVITDGWPGGIALASSLPAAHARRGDASVCASRVLHIGYSRSGMVDEASSPVDGEGMSRCVPPVQNTAAKAMTKVPNQ